MKLELQGLDRHRAADVWWVAFSGGLDSSVLLHALTAQSREQGGPPVRAVHVHHDLQAVADSWPAHCAQICAQLEVPLQVVRVEVANSASTEQAARDARYNAFAGLLQPGELLLLAQHRDDQAETLLLRLLRGAGVAGLQAMPLTRTLGHGQLLRPLLQASRRQLEDYARQHGLQWIEDPSNRRDDYDRNFIRNRIMPALRQRWSGLEQVLQRTAEHMQQAQGLLDELAALDLQQAGVEPPPDWLPLAVLNLDSIAALSPARQRNLLRFWLRDKTRLPDSKHWAGWQDLLQAAVDARPLWQLRDGALERYGRRLYWLPARWQEQPLAPALLLDSAGRYPLPGNGLLWLEQAPVQPLRVAYRTGGEHLELAGRGRRDLKRLLQEHQVPPFVRNRLPLLFAGQELVAVAGLPALRAAGWEQVGIGWTAAEQQGGTVRQ